MPELSIHLELDDHTFRDLEVFEAESGGTSLYEFCNLTGAQGGARVLRARMERPWADGAAIRGDD